MENKNEEKQYNKPLNPILTLFIFGFGLCSAFCFCEWLFKNKNTSLIFDFEKKNYIPFTHNNKLFVINAKNGKTYILNEIKTKSGYSYTYNLVGIPKNKKVYFNGTIDTNNPLGLDLDNNSNKPR